MTRGRKTRAGKCQENLTRWIVGWSAVISIGLAGQVVKLARLAALRWGRGDDEAKADTRGKPKPPVSSVRKALDRYGR